MSPAEIRNVLVVGAGEMGSGIAQTVAAAGFQTTVAARRQAGIDRCRHRIAGWMERGKLAPDAFARLTFTTDWEAAAPETDHVVEAVTERLDVKDPVLARLDALCRDDVILASTTSQFEITRLASVTRRPDRVIGTHWFNPPPVMKLIEVVRGEATSAGTLATTLALCERFGKQTVVCKRDTPGFITSRLIMLLVVEAARIVEDGVADAEDVDRACQLAFNHAMGPLHTADLGGLDTARLTTNALADALGERFRSPALLDRLVAGGDLGRKSGRGFHPYGG
ncbi:3-hydroxyacyl-CoA dehydrogenase family protein [Solirubrobacter ginsenosidimutans]|uniref:3-hydroxyacyl-CoA dehydrogenase family protein n=1 Tax=Solirubrobacter ginsenosidimutans TaxID=490573 RepID=A0A9X3MR37_9ACTN|nr:3-hydroxyacyl-CoA dehydrogenase family protein [Solirubrobacter ginsenosidimutans]MDA0160346.1 3-hydroxyacyl-CoA dehydrogenase family protein [Solirubrobacter ginsenosidimutans]